MLALTPKVYWVWCKTVSTTISRVLMMGLQCKTEETRNHSDIIENKTCAKSDQVSRNEKAQWIPLSIINWKLNTCACYTFRDKIESWRNQFWFWFMIYDYVKLCQTHSTSLDTVSWLWMTVVKTSLCKLKCNVRDPRFETETHQLLFGSRQICVWLPIQIASYSFL